jgi:hypothetical protein
MAAKKKKVAPPPGKALVVQDQDDVKLAAKIVDALKELDTADATRKEKAVAAGRLLAEAQKRHPSKPAFEKFLELAGGVQYRRAIDLIGIGLGRKDFDRHQADNAAAAKRHADKLRAEKLERDNEPKAKPKPEPAELKPSALANAPADDDNICDYDELFDALRLLATMAKSAECNLLHQSITEPIEPWVFPQIVADFGSEELHRIIKMLQAICQQRQEKAA